MQSVILCLSCFATVVYGYPNGARVGACETMTPGHGAAVQTGPSPYQVTLNNERYSPGNRITITVSGGTFRGLLVQARPANCSTVTFPTFSLMANESNFQTLDCNSVANSAVTHTNRNDKTQAEFYWTPAASLGHVYFRATVVQNFNTYWVGIQSSVLSDTNSADPVPDSVCDMQPNGGADLKSALYIMVTMLVALFLTV